jgi:hypothetical protein
MLPFHPCIHVSMHPILLMGPNSLLGIAFWKEGRENACFTTGSKDYLALATVIPSRSDPMSAKLHAL